MTIQLLQTKSGSIDIKKKEKYVSQEGWLEVLRWGICSENRVQKKIMLPADLPAKPLH